MYNQNHKKSKNQIIGKIVFLTIIITFSSCGIKPIISEKPYIKLPSYQVDLKNLGNGRIMIYNGDYYCPVAVCGTSTKVNIEMDNEALGQINYGEYFIVDLGTGSKNFHLEHVEVFKIKSDHKIIIDENTKILKLEPTDFSHKLTITNELPTSLQAFKQLTN